MDLTAEALQRMPPTPRFPFDKKTNDDFATDANNYELRTMISALTCLLWHIDLL